MAAAQWTNSVVEVAGTRLHVSRAGKGKPLLVLHHDIGTLDRLPFYDALAERFDVLVPHHPGLRPVGAAGLDAQRARHRRRLPVAAERA